MPLRARKRPSADPSTACFCARGALELAGSWANEHDASLKLLNQDNLSTQIHDPSVKEALAGFLNGKTWHANQIEFVNLIVNHLTEHGVMEAAMLYESPFTDLTPRGPDGLFTSSQVDDLVKILASVRARAIAA